MSVVLMYAGQKAKPVELLAVLEANHNERRTERLAEIMRRKDGGIPLDDGDGPLRELPAFAPDERLRGITATAVVLSPQRKRILEGDHTAAMEEFVAAPDTRTRAAAENAVYAARKAFVGEAIAEIDGLVGDAGERVCVVAGDVGGIPAEQLDKLELVGLVDGLFLIARRAQMLPLGKG